MDASRQTFFGGAYAPLFGHMAERNKSYAAITYDSRTGFH